MNERIKELITKCTWVLADEAGHKEVFDKEKFAQLLIRECLSELQISKRCDIYTGEVYINEYNQAIDDQIAWLKEHFQF